VGGPGLNLGIRDAAALAQVLAAAHREGRDIGSLSVLKKYERWRKLENWVILGFTDVLDRSFSNTHVVIMPLRRLGLQLMAALTPLKHLSLSLMTGMAGRWPVRAKKFPGFS
jgi:2-octaprenyl-6-methoxyphenol hydroxylase